MSDIVFRSIERNDVQELKDLHTECFPVHYDDIFFENICFGKGFKNAALYTLVGVEVESSRIVGCILGQFVKSKKCEDLGLFSELSDQARDVFYILTLGLRQEYRRSGLGEWFSVQSLFTFFIIFDLCISFLTLHHFTRLFDRFRPFLLFFSWCFTCFFSYFFSCCSSCSFFVVLSYFFCLMSSYGLLPYVLLRLHLCICVYVRVYLWVCMCVRMPVCACLW